ncbi:MAG: hypothetical protein CFE43_16175 [Burkholderiales bacterium PBB3]|nr:MAG: hypothetical protein CFE43_16175 [Burkholderiales bacterium PBB3]
MTPSPAAPVAPATPATPATPAHWAEIKALFDAVADLPTAERETLISNAGLAAAALAELQSLLAHHDQAQSFLAQPASDTLAGAAAHIGQRLGAWEIVRAIGAGGMGEVFEARRADGSYTGRAAIKLLKRGMDSAAVLQRFALERQALARLSHPHIARLLDAGASADGLPYFVLEYVDGAPLDQSVQTLSVRARLDLFLQLADAVAYAHRNLLVHRDLKPSNVLVDRDGQVKLLDFGIAKALDPMEGPGNHDSHTVGGQRPFTPNYASPEQVRGESMTTATDIYSLGVLLYQMLTGTRPTGRNATTPAEAARSVLEDAPTKPSRLSPQEALDPEWLQTRKKLEGDLDNILLKALEKTTERRYPSVDALAADVRAYLNGYAVSARAPGAGYLLSKFVARHRIAVASAALGLTALALGLAAALWQWQQAETARTAEAQRFAQVRTQANRLLFDYHDAILLLPGSTPLVARLLTDAREYLASLSNQAHNDAALLRELGVAHRRLGDLYTSSGRPSLGDVKQSLSQQQTAVALLTRAQALQPKNDDGRYQLALAQAALADTLKEQSDAQAALPLYEASRGQLDALAAQDPKNVAYRIEQVRAQLRLSDLYSSGAGASLGQAANASNAGSFLAQAGTLLEPLRRDFADDLDVAALYATTQNARYLAFAREGRWQDGLALLDALQPVFAQLQARAPDNTLHARDAAVNSLSRGTALTQLGRHAEAREAARDGLTRMQSIAAADPANRNAGRDVAKLQMDVANASLQLDDSAEALTHITPAVLTLEALAKADSADRRVAGLLALAQAAQAQALAARPPSPAQEAAVRQHADRALSVATALARSAPTDPSGVRAVALVHQQLAVTWQTKGRGPQSCQHWRAARDTWQQLKDSARLRPGDIPRLEAASQETSRCDKV